MNFFIHNKGFIKGLAKGAGAIALASSISMADESKSGVFVGADVGFATNFSTTKPLPQAGQQQQQTESTTTTNYPFGVVGLRLGYVQYFGSSFGVRAYGNYEYGFQGSKSTTTQTEPGQPSTITKENGLTSIHQATANIEAIWDFLHIGNASFGVYAGVGAGYGAHTESSTQIEPGTTTTTDLNKGSGFILPVNVGVEVGAGTHHRVGVNFKIPTIAASFKDNGTTAGNTTPTEYTSRNLILSVSYAYVF